MCTLAIYFQMTDDYPVVIAANRDEYLDRPAAKPTTLCERPHVVGGKDLRAGGTWLGVNEHGLVAGLLNRHIEAPPNRDARSRGLLCLDALRRRTAREAAEFAAGERAQDYNPFNLLIASRDATYVAYNRIERIEVVQLQPGFHLLTNLDVNDFECPRISASYEKFAELGKDVGFRRDPLLRRAAAPAIARRSQHAARSALRAAQFDLHASGRLWDAIVEPDFRRARQRRYRALLCARAALPYRVRAGRRARLNRRIRPR